MANFDAIEYNGGTTNAMYTSDAWIETVFDKQNSWTMACAAYFVGTFDNHQYVFDVSREDTTEDIQVALRTSSDNLWRIMESFNVRYTSTMTCSASTWYIWIWSHTGGSPGTDIIKCYDEYGNLLETASGSYLTLADRLIDWQMVFGAHRNTSAYQNDINDGGYTSMHSVWDEALSSANMDVFARNPHGFSNAPDQFQSWDSDGDISVVTTTVTDQSAGSNDMTLSTATYASNVGPAFPQITSVGGDDIVGAAETGWIIAGSGFGAD